MPPKRPAPLSDEQLNATPTVVAAGAAPIVAAAAPAAGSTTLLGVTNNGMPLPVKNTFIDVPSGMTPTGMSGDSRSHLATAPADLHQLPPKGFLSQRAVTMATIASSAAPPTPGRSRIIIAAPSTPGTASPTALSASGRRILIPAAQAPPLMTPSPTGAAYSQLRQQLPWMAGTRALVGGEAVAPAGLLPAAAPPAAPAPAGVPSMPSGLLPLAPAPAAPPGPTPLLQQAGSSGALPAAAAPAASQVLATSPSKVAPPPAAAAPVTYLVQASAPASSGPAGQASLAAGALAAWPTAGPPTSLAAPAALLLPGGQPAAPHRGAVVTTSASAYALPSSIMTRPLEPHDEDDDNDDEDSEGEDNQQQQLNQPNRKVEDAPKPPPGALHPSLGSEAHESGACKRCCFFPRGRCTNGYECDFCHYEHEKRKRKNKKKKKKDGATVPLAAPMHPAMAVVAGGGIPIMVRSQAMPSESTIIYQAASMPAVMEEHRMPGQAAVQPLLPGQTTLVYSGDGSLPPQMAAPGAPQMLVQGFPGAPPAALPVPGQLVAPPAVVAQTAPPPAVPTTAVAPSPYTLLPQPQPGPPLQQQQPLQVSYQALGPASQAAAPQAFVLQPASQAQPMIASSMLAPQVLQQGPAPPPPAPPNLQFVETLAPPPMQSPKFGQVLGTALTGSVMAGTMAPPPMLSPKLPRSMLQGGAEASLPNSPP